MRHSSGKAPGAPHRNQDHTGQCRSSVNEGEAPQVTGPGPQGGTAPPPNTLTRKEREPAPQPGKGPESTATVLTAPRHWHLPHTPRMRHSGSL